jgi:hypothetical protein
VPQYTPADVERRLNAGEWLGIAPLAVLFGVHRSTFNRWVNEHLVDTRPTSPLGGTAARECNPEQVKTLLTWWRGPRDTPPPRPQRSQPPKG